MELLLSLLRSSDIGNRLVMTCVILEGKPRPPTWRRAIKKLAEHVWITRRRKKKKKNVNNNNNNIFFFVGYPFFFFSTTVLYIVHIMCIIIIFFFSLLMIYGYADLCAQRFYWRLWRHLNTWWFTRRYLRCVRECCLSVRWNSRNSSIFIDIIAPFIVFRFINSKNYYYYCCLHKYSTPRVHNMQTPSCRVIFFNVTLVVWKNKYINNSSKFFSRVFSQTLNKMYLIKRKQSIF